MGTGSRFHIAAPLQIPRPSFGPRSSQKHVSEHKAHTLLGITEPPLNPTNPPNPPNQPRNQSVSSSNTVRLPALAFSDTTTELGSSSMSTPTETSQGRPTLGLKASSALLHDEFQAAVVHDDDDEAQISSRRSHRLQSRASSSTLHSYYDPGKFPLAISQQTSESSRRDFALRKGVAPVVPRVPAPAPAPSGGKSRRHSRLFGSLKGGGNKTNPQNATKYSTPSSSTSAGGHGQRGVVVPAKPRRDPSWTNAATATATAAAPLSTCPVTALNGFVVDSPASSAMRAPTKSSTPAAACRGGAGARHWFDGLGRESSGSDDHVGDQDGGMLEPELEPSFFAGMEKAFEKGRIGFRAVDSTQPCPYADEDARRGDFSPASRSSTLSPRPMLPASAIPPRVSTLNAKLSRSHPVSASSPPKASRTIKTKAPLLASTDLHNTSVLDLSSSDDDNGNDDNNGDEQDDDDEDTVGFGLAVTGMSLPKIRDSIALTESDIEIGMARAIVPTRKPSVRAPSHPRRAQTSQGGGGTAAAPAVRLSTRGPHQRGAPRLTYLSDQSSDQMTDDVDLLTSFPATPTDPASSRRASIQDSFISESGSIESRRLVSITRQEESLLAAMRWKRAAMSQPHLSSLDPTMRVGHHHHRHPRHPRQHAASPGVLMLDDLASLDAAGADVRDRVGAVNGHGREGFDALPGTMFAEGGLGLQSARLSPAGFPPERFVDGPADLPAPTGRHPSRLLSPASGTHRISQATFFSTSTSDSGDQARAQRDRSHRPESETLSGKARRDEVTSQEFIDWPYHGWKMRSKLSVAHGANSPGWWTVSVNRDEVR